jgi:RimJ/RimL family protein N-acetyltransferase
VRENNQAALALYQRFGFVETGRRKEYYVDNREDALILTLPELSQASMDALHCPGEITAWRRSN